MSSYIFVTVGTGKFDKLVEEMDKLVGDGKVKDKIVIQIGRGTYLPKNCEYFRFSEDLDRYYDSASLVISHGGPGTVFEILRNGKKLIAIPNRDRTDPMHQVEFLEGISAESKALLYCDDYSKIGEFIDRAAKCGFERYVVPECSVDKKIIEFLE